MCLSVHLFKKQTRKIITKLVTVAASTKFHETELTEVV